jgi:hypothetical protein
MKYGISQFIVFLEVPLTHRISSLPLSCGKVFLVGAGPGDPGLTTVHAVQCLQVADVVLFDALINPELMEKQDVTK